MRRSIEAGLGFLMPTLALVLSGGFLLFSELLSMYANNIEDFWFDFYVMSRPTMLLIGGAVGVILLVLLVAGVVAKMCSKKAIHEICLLIGGAGVLIMYIHANFLAGMLPRLDGTEIIWSGVAENVVSLVVCAIVIVGIVVMTLKLGLKRSIKIMGWVELAVVAMLGVSLLTTVTTKPVFDTKQTVSVTTTKNLNLVSTDENYFVLLVDAVDAKTFERALLELNKKEVLKDFSYFPDTLSGYPFTRDSIPLILSGKWNRNEDDFETYSTDAYNNSEFLASVRKKFPIKNFYDEEVIWRDKQFLEFDNVESVSKNIRVKTFIKQELKYLLFKMMPYPLKKYAKIQSMDFKAAQGETENQRFEWWDRSFYFETLEQEVQKTDKKVFSYIHLEGAHVPLTLDENMEMFDREGLTELEAYAKKAKACVKLIEKYLNYLKQNEAYDNATIVILADHGYNAETVDVPGRQNPILFVKAAQETHGSMNISEKQVSHVDMPEMLSELLDGKMSTDILKDILTDGRERNYMFYYFTKEDHMIEQTTTGKAWETEKLTPTGREFNR